ncbi:putative tubulin polyglutamylase TTLL9 isoform X1, partial [Clarias magur]
MSFWRLRDAPRLRQEEKEPQTGEELITTGFDLTGQHESDNSRSVLYQRQQLPMTYDQMVSFRMQQLATTQLEEGAVQNTMKSSADSTWQRCERALQELDEVLDRLEEVFSLSYVPRVLFMLGSSVILPTEIYEINMEALASGYKGYQKKRDGEGRSCVRFRCSLTNTILDVLHQRPGWVEVKEDGEWDFNWCDVGWLRENFDHSYMEEHVRISHFRNHYELTRKNLMVKNLKRYRKTLEREVGRLEAAKCDFFPRTFELPNEYHIFVEEFKRSPGSIWIMKPVARSQGKGIFLFRKLKDIMEWKKDGIRSEEQKDEAQVESHVAQRYIENPYLINGRKFDLRIYVLVTSYLPLKAWLYRDGFARFSNTRFSLSSIDDQYVHLTNVAVQKTAPDYDPEKGCKWHMQQLRCYLTAKHGREAVEALFKDIDTIFIRSLQSVQKVIINDKHCFELYGYDILLDQDLKP